MFICETDGSIRPGTHHTHTHTHTHTPDGSIRHEEQSPEIICVPDQTWKSSHTHTHTHMKTHHINNMPSARH